jgi:hypothetical protein
VGKSNPRLGHEISLSSTDVALYRWKYEEDGPSLEARSIFP